MNIWEDLEEEREGENVVMNYNLNFKKGGKVCLGFL